METTKFIKLNTLVSKAYECTSFVDFLKLAIFSLHELVLYDSGMFFCAISKDSSFFKPYISGPIEKYYKKQKFEERKEYLDKAELNEIGKEAYVFTAKQYAKGLVNVSDEPRSNFLKDTNEFHIACLRIVYKDQFLGEIYLHRSKEKEEYSEEDMLVLRMLQPHISTIFSNIHNLAAIKATEESGCTLSKKGMCIINESMIIESGNIIGIEMLRSTTVFGSSILYHVKELCKEMLESRKETNAAILKTQYGKLQINIFFRESLPLTSKKEFVLIMEILGEEQAVSDYKFKFSDREAEIIDEIVQGKNNQQIAKTLSLSENTIKTHIKNIFKKTGVNNRTELAYLLMLNVG